MTTYVALLRAVNVGGTGKLAMEDLRTLCESIGFEGVRTYIASGNVVFRSKLSANAAKAALEKALERHTGKPLGILIRTAAQMTAVLAANPFTDTPANRTVTIFLDQPPPSDTLAGVTGRQDEEIALGKAEIYVHYGQGMGHSKLKIKVAVTGTARNMNTVAKLAEWAS